MENRENTKKIEIIWQNEKKAVPLRRGLKPYQQILNELRPKGCL